MKLLTLICVCFLGTAGYAQKSSILFVVNESFPVSHSKISYKIIRNSEFETDSISKGILNNLLEFTFLNVDSNHYQVKRKLVSQTRVNAKKLYSFNDFESNNSPFSKPNFEVFKPHVERQYDYVVFINKVDILREMKRSKLRFWFSIFSGDGTELMSAKHVSRYNLSGGMSAFELLQNLARPAESFEERMLNTVDMHKMEGKVSGTYEGESYAGHYRNWRNGSIILLNGDTLHGQVKYVDPYKINYRRLESTDSRIVLSNQIDRIDIGNYHYRSLFIHQIPGGNLGKHAIMRVLNDGKICLYRLGENEMSKFFICKGDVHNKVHLTPDKRKITNPKTVSQFFKENEEFSKKVYNRDFGIRDLQKLVFLYNQ